MKRALLLGLVAMFGVSILSESAEARLFGRRRGGGGGNCSSCSTAPSCNSCQTGQCDSNYQHMNADPNAPGYAPPPAPNAQSYNGLNNNQGNTTFYRGQPQLAPNSQGGVQAGANLNAPAAPNANIQGRAGTNLNAPAAPNANIQGRAGANLNSGNTGRANVGAGANADLND